MPRYKRWQTRYWLSLGTRPSKVVLAAHDTLNAVSTSLSHSLNPPSPPPQVRPTLEKESGQVFQEYVAETYCSQVVAGINYFIKVYIPNYVMKLPSHV